MDGSIFQRDGAKKTGSPELEYEEGGFFTTGDTETPRRRGIADHHENTNDENTKRPEKRRDKVRLLKAKE
jgi:hypothetical protein